MKKLKNYPIIDKFFEHCNIEQILEKYIDFQKLDREINPRSCQYNSSKKEYLIAKIIEKVSKDYKRA